MYRAVYKRLQKLISQQDGPIEEFHHDGLVHVVKQRLKEEEEDSEEDDAEEKKENDEDTDEQEPEPLPVEGEDSEDEELHMEGKIGKERSDMPRECIRGTPAPNAHTSVRNIDVANRTAVFNVTNICSFATRFARRRRRSHGRHGQRAQGPHRRR